MPDVVRELLDRIDGMGFLTLELPYDSGFDADGVPYYAPWPDGRFRFRAVLKAWIRRQVKVSKLLGVPRESVMGETVPIITTEGATRKEALEELYRYACVVAGQVPRAA